MAGAARLAAWVLMDIDPAADLSRTDQIASSEALAALEHLQDAGSVQAGAVNLIGLEAIRAHLEERWPAKRGRVWEHVERDFARRLTAHDLYFRLDEATYLVAMPTTPKYMAQAVCLSILQDVLAFFLGEAKMRDVMVRQVRKVEDGRMTSDHLEPEAILVEATARATTATSSLDLEAPPAPQWKPPLAGRTHSISFMTESRRTAKVRMGIEDVVNLRRGLVTSYVLERRIDPPLTHPADITRADCAVMTYAVELLQEHRTQGGRLALHLPISFGSAATRQARDKVLGVLAPVRDLLRSTVLFEICDLDAGVPQSRLIEVVALLKPFCMAVLGRIRPSKAGLAAVKGCGLQGLVLDATGINREGPDLAILLKAFSDAALSAAPNVLVHNLAHENLIGAAARAGLTHASKRPALSVETEIDAA